LYRLKSLEYSESSVLNILIYIGIIAIPILLFLPEINVLYFWVTKDLFASNALTSLSTIQILTYWVLVNYQITGWWIIWHGYAVYNQVAYLAAGYFHLKCLLIAANTSKKLKYSFFLGLFRAYLPLVVPSSLM